MHYYQFNIGDYRAATAHLSNDEDLAYRRLLDMYYDTEAKIPLDTQWVAKRLRLGSDVVDAVLADMFVKHQDGWYHARCDHLIQQYQAMAEKNRANGRLGGRKKNTDTNPMGSEWQPSAKATINDKLETNNDIEGNSPEPRFPDCPHEEILALWQKRLPHLSQPRIWEGNRRTSLRLRWIQASKPSSYSVDGYKTKVEGLQWWDEFFAYIANETTLAKGFESNGRTWRPDLEWVLNAGNFAKIIDGKYDK